MASSRPWEEILVPSEGRDLKDFSHSFEMTFNLTALEFGSERIPRGLLWRASNATIAEFAKINCEVLFRK